jgi:hypothetical protein
LLPAEIKTNFVQFLDVVIDLMAHIYDRCDSTLTREVRQMLVEMDGRMEFHHDLAVTRLAALHYRCRALASSQYQSCTGGGAACCASRRLAEH